MLLTRLYNPNLWSFCLQIKDVDFITWKLINNPTQKFKFLGAKPLQRWLIIPLPSWFGIFLSHGRVPERLTIRSFILCIAYYYPSQEPRGMIFQIEIWRLNIGNILIEEILYLHMRNFCNLKVCIEPHCSRKLKIWEQVVKYYTVLFNSSMVPSKDDSTTLYTGLAFYRDAETAIELKLCTQIP